MNARVKKSASDAEIAAAEAALEIAELGLSWTSGRITPMIEALGALATFSSEKPGKANERLELIRAIATEAGCLMNDVEHYFESERTAMKEKLAALEGGAR